MEEQTLRKVEAKWKQCCGIPTRTSPQLKDYHLHNLDESDSHVARLCNFFSLFIIILLNTAWAW